jgi:hypothetical protein
MTEELSEQQRAVLQMAWMDSSLNLQQRANASPQ